MPQGRINTLLTRAEAQGDELARRGFETFHPIMSQIEALFLDLQERRQHASTSPSPCVLSLILSTFSCYATNAEATASNSLQLAKKQASLPSPVRAFRGELWDLLRWSLPEELHDQLWAELVRKHSNSQI